MASEKSKSAEKTKKLYRNKKKETPLNPSTNSGHATQKKHNSSGLVLASKLLPTRIPILAVRQRPFFPGLPVPLEIVGKNPLDAINWASESTDKTLGLVLMKDPSGEEIPENLYHVGVAAKIIKTVDVDSEVLPVLMNCLERFTIKKIETREEGLFARVEYHYALELSVNMELKACSLAIISCLKELVKLDPLQAEAIKIFLSRSSLNDPGKLADFAAHLTTAEGSELQKILETFDVRTRINRVLTLLHRELELSKLQR